MAATRLDRLVTLLDTGSTPAIRATAAKQIGQIAALRIRGQSTAQQAAAASATIHFKPAADPTNASGTSTPSIDPYADGLAKDDPTPSSGSGSATDAKYGSSQQRSRQQHQFDQQQSYLSDDKHIYRGTDGDWEEITSYLARVVPFLRSKS